jgi:hypothetical protein
MHDTHEDVLAGLSSTPVVLEQLLTSAGSTGPADGWNAAEVVWHLREAEERGLERMRAMRDQENPFLPAYDQAALARDGRYAERAIDSGVREFAALRNTMLQELRALPSKAWDRTGSHEEVGTITILNQAIHLLGHDLNHLAQLARLLAPAPVG